MHSLVLSSRYSPCFLSLIGAIALTFPHSNHLRGAMYKCWKVKVLQIFRVVAILPLIATFGVGRTLGLLEVG
jgi:hypothetical protein